MKKLILLVSAILLSFFVTHAQFGWGVKGGLTMARINLDLQNNLSSDVHYGAHGGVFCMIGKGLLSFQPEVMFIQKGVHVNDSKSDDYAQATLNYMNIPLLARASIGLKAVELYFHFGGYGAYLLSSKRKISTSEDLNGHSYEVDDFNDYDAGVIIGGGLKVLSLIVELRYGHGLINVSNNTDRYGESKNSHVNVSLGMQF